MGRLGSGPIIPWPLPDAATLAKCPELSEKVRTLLLWPRRFKAAGLAMGLGQLASPPDRLPLTYENLPRNDTLADAYDLAGRANTAARVRDCGRRWVCYMCGTTGKEWRVPWRCHDRNCPVCAKIRAARLFHKYSRFVERPGLKMVTLTVPSVKFITHDYVCGLRKQVSRLLHRKEFREAWVGGFYGIETTWSAEHGYHVHVHLLVEGAYVSWPKLKAAWSSITGHKAVVWINAADNPRQAFKYPLKTNDLESMGVPRLAAYLIAVKGLRLAQVFGSWHPSYKGGRGLDDGQDDLGAETAELAAVDDKQERLACPYCGKCDYSYVVTAVGVDVSAVPLARGDWRKGVWTLDG
ncbi:hypothetical protein ES705_31123 [subsurface metagenome]